MKTINSNLTPSHLEEVTATVAMRKLCLVLQSSGKKSTAIRILAAVSRDLGAIVREGKLTNLEGKPLANSTEAIMEAIIRVSPFVMVSTIKRGGANVKIPSLRSGMSSCGFGIRILVEGAIARASGGIPLAHALLLEMVAVLKGEDCASLKKYRNIQKEAKANRMFIPRTEVVEEADSMDMETGGDDFSFGNFESPLFGSSSSFADNHNVNSVLSKKVGTVEQESDDRASYLKIDNDGQVAVIDSATGAPIEFDDGERVENGDAVYYDGEENQHDETTPSAPIPIGPLSQNSDKED